MNSFLLLVSVRGLTSAECIQIALFFSHQCNTTVCFVEAVQTLISDSSLMKQQSDRNISLYRILGEICIKKRNETSPGDSLRIEDIEEMKDVGCGIYPRFCPSNTSFFSEEKVKVYVDHISRTCDEYGEEMEKSNKSLDKLKLVSRFTECMRDIPGIADLRSQSLCQLCALFGLIPLDFYTHLPMHDSGGPGRFMSEQMNFTVTRRKKLWN